MPFKKLILCSAMLAALGATAPALAAPQVLPDFTQLVEQHGRAVVNIRTVQTVREMVRQIPEGMQNDPFAEFFRRFAPPQLREYRTGGLGSGFILSADGYILTNAHVVAEADEMIVTLSDKRELKARLIGSDARTDVALLKVDAANLPTVKLGRSEKLKVGEWVLAIGSPFGFESTVTSGIVSAKGRQLPDESYVPFIQTDAAINPGNSGGPLFNLDGEVVGINSQIYSRSGGFMGISFAIPIDVALNVAEQLKKDGKVNRSRLGVSIQELTRELAASFGLKEPQGALINSVEKGGPAELAGLRAGDVVLSVNRDSVQASADLPRLIGAIKPGSRVELGVWRNRALSRVTVLTVALQEEDPRTVDRAYHGHQQQDGDAMNRTGLSVQLLAPQLAQQLGVKFGLQVRQVEGPAQRAGIVVGDVIIGVAGSELTSVKQLQDAIAATPAGQALPMRLLRQGNPLFVALVPEKKVQ
ncbi:DegQ family serine endoprotease [Vogesella indigofera]|uniref:Probable periplasmic serine endoprotease DegP-like n=1 Tax=Vogesella indigofera TaxID=45465 RepID=A0ABT5I2L3_VOGIN|nr:DegQ family serine endoprotease [Vogesella indigofera]MDC7690405.1 DegQ family serine endoprotease [Vogesella indigofera]